MLYTLPSSGTSFHLVAQVKIADDGSSVDLTIALIRDKCLSTDAIQGKGGDDIADLLSSLKVVHLEWQRIGGIQNLDFFTSLADLYLQHNRIEVIENLDLHAGTLRYLALGGNRIRKVENLKHLRMLQFLDLSENQIDELDEEDLPRSLMILNLSLNQCCYSSGYRGRLIKSLPKLVELDEEDVHRESGAENSDMDGEETAGRDHAYIKEAIEGFWNVEDLVKDAQGEISRSAYTKLMSKLYYALVPGADEEEAVISCEEDWERDLARQELLRQEKGEGRHAGGESKEQKEDEQGGGEDERGGDAATSLGYDAFHETMFETAQYWSSAEFNDGTEYATFLRQLLKLVADTKLKPTVFRPDSEIRMEAEKGNGLVGPLSDSPPTPQRLSQGGAAEQAFMAEVDELRLKRDGLLIKAMSALDAREDPEEEDQLEGSMGAEAHKKRDDIVQRSKERSAAFEAKKEQETGGSGGAAAREQAQLKAMRGRADEAKEAAKRRLNAKRAQFLAESKNRLADLQREMEVTKAERRQRLAAAAAAAAASEPDLLV
jgi:hypothetical protein